MPKLELQIWSDIACPWCWVGKRNLEAAIAASPHEVAITWRAFELDPTMPKAEEHTMPKAEENTAPEAEEHTAPEAEEHTTPEAEGKTTPKAEEASAPEAGEAAGEVDYAERLAAKYGTTRDEAQAMIDRMTASGAAAGVEMRFDRIRPTNTFDAHRLLHWAQEQGRGNELKEALFVAYLRDGRSVSDPEVLADLVQSIGLDPEAARALLGADTHAEEVRADEALATRLGIRSVPTLVVDHRYALQGAQPPEQIAAVLERAATSDPRAPA